MFSSCRIDGLSRNGGGGREGRFWVDSRDAIASKNSPESKSELPRFAYRETKSLIHLISFRHLRLVEEDLEEGDLINS